VSRFIYYAECRDAECRYAECHGAIPKHNKLQDEIHFVIVKMVKKYVDHQSIK
jgi:hypothetical protein